MLKAGMIVCATDFGAEREGSCKSSVIAADSIWNAVSDMDQFVLQRFDISRGPSRTTLPSVITQGVWFKRENEWVIDQVRCQTRRTFNLNMLPFMIGGDHSSSIGSVLECNAMARERNLSLGVLWIDSHPDMNTPGSSPSGRLHGMAVASTLNLVPLNLTSPAYLSPDQFLAIGINSIDPLELLNLQANNMLVLTANDVLSGDASFAQVIRSWADRFDALYVSIDLDSISPSEIPGVNAPCDHALPKAIVMEFFDEIPWEKVVMWDLVEYNRDFDKDGITLHFLTETTKNILRMVKRSHERSQRTLAPFQ